MIREKVIGRLKDLFEVDLKEKTNDELIMFMLLKLIEATFGYNKEDYV